MPNLNVDEELEKAGSVLLNHHFVYKKKNTHGPHYINVDPIFPNLGLLKQLCNELGSPFFGKVETVASAATGGIPLSVLTALGLVTDDGRYPAAIWADKVGDDFEFQRASFIDYIAGKRVLFVEDLLNAGDTTRKVVAQIRRYGGEVVAVSVICNRGKETAETLGVPHLAALTTVDMQAYDVADCPQCKAKVPIVLDIGHGATYQQEHPDYPGGFVSLLAA